jgi:membrane protease YdiL (CAAX protease family)
MTPLTAASPARVLTVARAAAFAFAIALVPQGVWSALIVLNVRTSPNVPWAVILMPLLLGTLWLYLDGRWGNSRTREARRRRLRARLVPGRVFAWALLAGGLSLVALTGLWIVLAQFVRMPGSVLPPAGPVSRLMMAVAVAMGAMISPLCEQAGIWGYAQVILERDYRPATAIAISAVLFALLPHPPMQVALIPKFLFFFLTGLTFAVSAYLAGSILPGIIVHALGLFTFFTLIWPGDPGRALVAAGGADAWFWVHVAQVIVCTALASAAFARLASIRRRERPPERYEQTETVMGQPDVSTTPAITVR